MNRYMAQFIMDRFIEFEIQQPQAKGLKIPVTAVTEKNFYMVPKSYAAQGGDSTDIGFNKEVGVMNMTGIIGSGMIVTINVLISLVIGGCLAIKLIEK